jgi:hypothetical protein
MDLALCSAAGERRPWGGRIDIGAADEGFLICRLWHSAPEDITFTNGELDCLLGLPISDQSETICFLALSEFVCNSNILFSQATENSAQWFCDS